MPTSRARLAVLSLIALTSVARLLGQEEQETVTLANSHGVSVEFTEFEEGWRWTALNTPGAPEGGWPVSDRSVPIATADREEMLAREWSLTEATAERLVFEQRVESVGVRVRRIFLFGPAANVLRVETWVRSMDAPVMVARIGLLEAHIRGERFRETGTAPASFPLFGHSHFAGIEHVSGESHGAGDVIQLVHRPRLETDGGWQFVAAGIVGWPMVERSRGLAARHRIREAFLQYLDTVRIKPEDMVLHSETWWTLPPPLYEKDILNDIETLRKVFHERTGMFFDTYALDLGWSDPRSLWRIETQRFPNEFRVINEKLNALGSRLGLWMSPGSGYPDGLSNPWLQSQGYQLTPFEGLEPGAPCFALGTRYQREFKERIVAYAQQYGLGHAIFDFMALQCNEPGHGHPAGYESRYAIDAGLADVLDALRAVTPNIALEPMVCGYPPSPWWLMKSPFVLGPAGDDLPYGRVPCPEWMESLISARDIAYRTSQESWIMPTQALETWDIIVQTPGEFENTAVMAIGRGRWFISTYIRPELMKPEDWDFFAALIRWARHNKEHLVNAWIFGGKPEDREAYGFMFRNAAKDIHCIRNPWIEERFITVPVAPGATEARELRMIYPRRVTLARIEPGEAGPRIAVAPYETIMLETVPSSGTNPVLERGAGPLAAVANDTNRAFTRAASLDDESEIRYFWEGAISVPEVSATEVCILVEGGTEVERATCRIMVGGREVTARKTGSAGQFGAATDPSPENWTWFIVPIAPGPTTLQIELGVQAEQASIGVFLRGYVPANHDRASDGDGPVFPVFNPERRAWSQSLLPLKAYVVDRP